MRKASSSRQKEEADQTIDLLSKLDNIPEITDSPRDIGVPHSEWRPNQLQALKYIQGKVAIGDPTPVFTELPTGSGKSAIPTAIGHKKQVLVLVQSLALLDQYAERYGFDVVKGMQAYNCILPAKIEYWQGKYGKNPTVADCHFEKMTDCPVYDNCPYIVAREKALASRRMACTYPFALLSHLVQTRGGVSFWDECHLAADTILALSEIRFTESFRSAYELPPIPMVGYKGIMTSYARTKIVDWIATSIKITDQMPTNLFMEEETHWRGANNKLRMALQAISNVKLDWYLESSTALESEHVHVMGRYIDRPVTGFLFKPLSPSFSAGKLLANKELTVLMSATIGDPMPLAGELGFKTFHFQSFEHPIPKDKRLVIDMGQERMTYDNLQKSPVIYRIQAAQIAKFIQSLDPAWRGLVLTSSYFKASKIKEYLDETELRGRIYVPPAGHEDLSGRINSFLVDVRPGLIVVDIMHGWGHGLDLFGDLARYVVVASVPFGNHQDDFEKARLSVAHGTAQKYAWWQSYMHVPQACGRVSRGELADDGSYLFNVSALADGSATTNAALSYYPGWFKEAIIPWSAYK